MRANILKNASRPDAKNSQSLRGGRGEGVKSRAESAKFGRGWIFCGSNFTQPISNAREARVHKKTLCFLFFAR